MRMLHVAAMAMKDKVKFPQYKINERRRVLLERVLCLLLVTYLICPCVIFAGLYSTSDRVVSVEHIRDNAYLVDGESHISHLWVRHKPVHKSAPQALYGNECIDIIRTTFCGTFLYWISTSLLIWVPIALYLEGDDFYGGHNTNQTTQH